MARTMVLVVVVCTLVAVALLAGCPKSEQTELQGAPQASAPPPAPGTHVMPGGQKMNDSQMAGMKGMKGESAPASTPVASAKADTASCPVLGTTMAKKDMIAYDYKGKTYYFCCSDCVTKFKADPEKYIKHPAKALPLGAPMPSG